MSVRLLARTALLVAGASLTAQGAQVTTEHGVYTGEQAARGRAAYEAGCQQCHGRNLSGGVGRQLTGDAFIADWTSLRLDQLFERVRTMPPGDAPRLPDDEYLSILAYILEANGFRAGDHALTAETAKTTAIAGRSSPPDSGLVWVVGCLARSAAGAWTLTGASDPARTTDPNPSGAAERTRRSALPPGTRNYRLLNVFPSPDRLDGHRVEVKGLLIAGRDASLNVTGIETVAAACGANSRPTAR